MDRRWLTPAKAAVLYDVHPKSLARWANDGIVEVRRTPGGHRRYSAESLENVLGVEHAQIEIDKAAIMNALRGVA